MRELDTQIMKSQPMVSYTAGSMNSLVHKLTKLKNRPLAIQELLQDLVKLQGDFFHKVCRRRETNLQVEAWMKLVREMVFDIEDWIDQKPDMGGQQLEIEDEIKSFIARVKHAGELCQRYDLVVEGPTDIHDHFAVVPVQVKNDHFRLAVHDLTDELVKHMTRERENKVNELVNLLEGQQKRLNVVTILGMEGLGKTTLAEEIYAELQGKFDCHAFVSVGRRKSVITTLTEILSKVKSSHKKEGKPKTSNPRSERREAKDLQKVITDLSEFLCTKRYFIVVDGLWSTRTWKIINCAFPNENHGSRVLTTTCISDVAKGCSARPTDVYQMAALSEEMSGRLLYQIATQEDLCHNDEAIRNMLKMCDGMPLAIIATAGLLAMQSEEVTDPNMFWNCILSPLEHCYTSGGMMKILHMSYAALSLPLKSCFLYLSVFREDYTIKKDRVIRLWIAEGFIPTENKEIRGEETTRVEKTTRDEERRDEKTRAKEIRCEETRGEKETKHEETIKREETGGEETRDEETTKDENTRGGETGNEETTRGEETRGEETKRGQKTTIGEEKRDEESLWETGERYFNELITRRLIQPVFDCNDDQAMGCTVHGVILDFIKSMSSKGNFVTVRADVSSGGSTDTVRRFTLDCYNDEDEDGDDTLASVAVHLSRVRSITIWGDTEGMGGRSALTTSGKIEGNPVLPCFKHIQVLDLEGTDNLGSRHLEGIGGLVLLKYLGVAGTDIDKLPEEIGELKQLETLDLRHTKLRTLPVSIVKQERLAHLLIDNTVNVPSEILKMQGLEEVSNIGVDSSSSIDPVVELLRESECLRVLGLRLDGSHLSSDNNSVRSFLRQAKGLFEQVSNSTELRSLSLDCIHGDLFGLLLESPPSNQLRRFVLTISAPVLKGTAHNMASLVSVTHMDIQIIQLDDKGVRVLENLPNLVLLNLVSSGRNSQYKKHIRSSRKSIKDRCTLSVVGFKRLKVFSFTCLFGGTELEFTRGAMPELQRLSFRFSARETLCLFIGMKHLSALKLVKITINCKYATASAVKNAEDEIKAQVGNFPVVPTTEFIRINQHIMVRDHKAKPTYQKFWVNGCIPNIKISYHPKC